MGSNPFLNKIAGLIEQLPLPTALVMPGGQRVGASDGQARVVIRLHHLGALAHIATGQIGKVAADYVEGTLDLDGNMRDLMTVAAALLDETDGNPTHVERMSWIAEALHRLRSFTEHTRERDAQQIQFHYDVSDDFYALWLDPRRVYSCAYYREKDDTLAQAQEAKLDHICRKLKLQAGERFLDVGAGWGGLLLWAAEHYGVDATGITLSKNQHAYVNRLIEQKGLGNRVRMALCDYRELKAEPFDKVASVGMFEHVGLVHMVDYFGILRRLLKPGGLVMNHGITAGGTRNTQLGGGMGDFIGKYIFPGGELIHISEVLRCMSEGSLEPVDIESLRPHYAKTLWAWSDGLEAQLDEARRVTSDKTVRAYRLYLAGCAMAFEHDWISLFQVLGTHPNGNLGAFEDITGLRGGQSVYPFNREYIYR